MITRFLIPALILFGLSSASMAAPPSGPYTVPFSSAVLAVWDISGDYSETEFGVTSDISLNQDDRGMITGAGTATGTVEGFDVDLDLTFRGTIRAKSNVTTVKLATKVTGDAGGLPVRGALKFTFEIDNADGTLVGSARGRVCVRGAGCAPVNDSAVFDIPTGDGSWDLMVDLDVGANGKSLTGTGSAVLSNGRDVDLIVKGAHSAKTDTAKLAGKGVGNGIAAKVRDVTGDLVIDTLKGKLLGQTLKLP